MLAPSYHWAVAAQSELSACDTLAIALQMQSLHNSLGSLQYSPQLQTGILPFITPS